MSHDFVRGQSVVETCGLNLFQPLGLVFDSNLNTGTTKAGILVSKKQNYVSSQPTHKDTVSWGASETER